MSNEEPTHNAIINYFCFCFEFRYHSAPTSENIPHIYDSTNSELLEIIGDGIQQNPPLESEEGNKSDNVYEEIDWYATRVSTGWQGSKTIQTYVYHHSFQAVEKFFFHSTHNWFSYGTCISIYFCDTKKHRVSKSVYLMWILNKIKQTFEINALHIENQFE